jgi:hypothetical protein
VFANRAPPHRLDVLAVGGGLDAGERAAFVAGPGGDDDPLGQAPGCRRAGGEQQRRLGVAARRGEGADAGGQGDPQLPGVGVGREHVGRRGPHDVRRRHVEADRRSGPRQTVEVTSQREGDAVDHLAGLEDAVADDDDVVVHREPGVAVRVEVTVEADRGHAPTLTASPAFGAPGAVHRPGGRW